MGRLLVALLLALAVTGCAGESPLDRCIAHSVEEGIDASVAEQACREVVSES